MTSTGSLEVKLKTGLPVVAVAIRIGDPKVTMTTDYTARMTGLPAGATPHGLVYSTVKAFGAGTELLTYPGVAEVVKVVEKVGQILEDANKSWDDPQMPHDPRLALHMGASFLIGRPRVEIDTPAPVGGVGSVLYHLHQSHTLAKSPLVTRFQGTNRVKAYVSLHGYDLGFDRMCEGMKVSRPKVSESLKRLCSSVSPSGLADVSAYLTLSKWSPGTEADKRKKYDEFARAYEAEVDETVDADDTMETEVDFPSGSQARKRPRADES